MYHKEFKNIEYNGLCEPYAVTVGWAGWMGHTPSIVMTTAVLKTNGGQMF